MTMRQMMWKGALLLAALAGCAQAPTTAYRAAALQTADATIDEATQSLVYAAAANVTAVDAHLTINGARAANVRMQQGADGRFVAGPLSLRADDVVSYWFTYFVDGRGHDTAAQSHTMPLTFEPRALRPEVRAAGGGYVVRLVAQTRPAWADVHYVINGGTQENVRLGDVGGTLGLPIALGANDVIDYWMTYASGAFVFDTGHAQFRPSAPTAALLWVDGFPVVNPGDRVPAGCSAAGSGYSCDPYAFSRVYTDGAYRFDDGASLAPFSIVGTGPYGDSLVKTLPIAFHYDGAAPRSGEGLLLLPTSAAHNGIPPLDADDGNWGKQVSTDWSLRASYVLGGDGLAVSLVDVNGVHGNAMDLASYRSTYCRYGCALKIPVSALAAGTDLDLSQIRYVAFQTEGTATVDQSLTIGNILFDDFPF
jgi:hypothetical protein